jgi:CHAT domain-containing protein
VSGPIFVDQVREKYLLAKEIANSRNISLTFSLKALESNRDIPVSFTAPWKLIHDDEGFLCLKYSFIRLPRGAKIYPISRVSPNIKSALLIAANPGGGSSNIPEVDEEITFISNMLEEMNIKTTCITSENAKSDTILEKLEECNFQVMHFAGHGYFDQNHSEDSYLLVGTRNTGPFRLSARTLCEYARGSALSMVFLGSCFSAQSEHSNHMRPWEILGILDAFIQAGVPTCIGMQWSVSSRGALILAQHFYKSLKQGSSVEESLRRARRHLGGHANWQDMTWLSPILVKFPL